MPTMLDHLSSYLSKYQWLAAHRESTFSAVFHDSLFGDDSACTDFSAFDDTFPPFHNSSSETLTVSRQLDSDDGGSMIALEVPSDGAWAVTASFSGISATIGLDAPNTVRWGVEREFELGATAVGPAKAVLQYDGSMHAASAHLQMGPLATRLTFTGAGGDCCGEPGCPHEEQHGRSTRDVTQSGLQPASQGAKKQRVVTDVSVFFPVFAGASDERDDATVPSLLRLALSGSNMPNVDPLLFGMSLNYRDQWRFAFSFPLHEAALEEREVFGWQTNLQNGRLLLSGLVAGRFAAIPSFIRSQLAGSRRGRRGARSEENELPVDMEVSFKWLLPSTTTAVPLLSFPTTIRGGISTERTAGLGIDVQVVDVGLGLGMYWDSFEMKKPLFGITVEF